MGKKGHLNIYCFAIIHNLASSHQLKEMQEATAYLSRYSTTTIWNIAPKIGLTKIR